MIGAMKTNSFLVRPGQKVDLRRYDAGDTGPFKSRQAALAK